MGLGPPVCEKCDVICEHSLNGWLIPNEDVPDKFKRYRTYWRCPICHNLSPKKHSGFSEENLNRLKANYERLIKDQNENV